ncbi:MAG: 50S ribosome-binding GTPase [Phycisphaerae bacterium]|jgi:tRNA modification GTPase|nr:50S ribosome-binding GTPase [Phycisphaerae bacterium]
MDLASTIVARGSAPGRSLRSLVRMSGEACGPVLAAMDESSGRYVRGVRKVRLRFGCRRLACLAFCAVAPASATGEDTLDLLVPGNPDLVAWVESELLGTAARLGHLARPAAPGEFTLRAFARGRIDLTQAEGIAATIAASTTAQLRAARQLADGGLGRFVADLADRTANDLALVEAGIDFTDQEDVVAIEPVVLAGHVGESISAIRLRLERSVPMERIEATPRVVLVGLPNAGKSTLFNALLGRRRAVESPIAGTTRDALEEVAMIETPRGRSEVRLVDVAGVDESGGGFNPAMQERMRAAVERADLVVECVAMGADGRPLLSLRDNSSGGTGGEQEGSWRSAPRVMAATKADLAVPRYTADGDRSPPAPPTDGAVTRLAVSARTGFGLDDLRAAIVAALASRVATLSDETVILAARHETSLRDALAAFEACRTTLASSSLRAPELVAASLRTALDALGAISGRIAPDDVLGRIFGKFCIGK